MMGQLAAGILLGPSVFGLVWRQAQQAVFPDDPAQKAMLDAIAQFGVLLLLLLTGMDADAKLIRTVGRPALAISATGVLVPFACGASLGFMLPPEPSNGWRPARRGGRERIRTRESRRTHLPLARGATAFMLLGPPAGEP